jgi:histidinol-phosphate aminotransferase
MTTPEKVIRDDIRAISAYHIAPAAGMVKLDAMENPYPLPEALQREIGALAARAALNRYPDPTAGTLKQRLRSTMQIPAACDILLGNGSDEIIQLVVSAAARAGAVVMAPEPTFVMYRLSAGVAQSRYVGVPLEADFSLDPQRFIGEMAAHRPSVVFISYPNNPSGNLYAEQALVRIIEKAPGLVIVDEAYHVFAGRTFMTRLGEFSNLMVLRTVSKLGLAGLRLGYAAARPEWIREFEKVRPPYNVGVLTQLIAERILASHAELEAQAVEIRADRAKLAARLQEMPGVAQFPSDANFILARVPDAPRIYAGLARRRVLVRNLHGSHPLLDHCLRFTVGTPGENVQLVAALAESLAEL